MGSGNAMRLLLSDNSYRRAGCTRIKDDDLRWAVSVIYAMMHGVDHFDDGISCLEVQRLPVSGHDRELPPDKHAGVYHRVAMRVEFRAHGDADAHDGDLGLALRVGGQ